MYHEELESLVQNLTGLKRARFWMTFSENYLNHLKELDGHDVLALEAHGIDAGHAHIAQHLEVVQVILREGHPEIGRAHV